MQHISQPYHPLEPLATPFKIQQIASTTPYFHKKYKISSNSFAKIARQGRFPTVGENLYSEDFTRSDIKDPIIKEREDGRSKRLKQTGKT